jgi:FkbM family methyltransferase
LTPELIVRNVEANGIPNVTVVPVGVADRSGEAEMHVGDALIDASVARAPSCARFRRTVPRVTLDEYVEREGLERVDFIKMDIEGAEELALRDARGVIERFRPRWSIASYHTDFEGDPQHPKLVRLLRDFGYTVREVERKRIFAWMNA